MNAADRHQLLAILISLVTALFVISGLPPVARWRLALRRAVIVGYLFALALALIEVAQWLLSIAD
jgi:hypothetical protein